MDKFQELVNRAMFTPAGNIAEYVPENLLVTGVATHRTNSAMEIQEVREPLVSFQQVTFVEAQRLVAEHVRANLSVGARELRLEIKKIQVQ